MSIQIRLNGLSFCILNRSSNTIEYIAHIPLNKKATPYELLNELKQAVDSKIELQQTFDTITCIYQNELACIVPNPFFDKDNLAEYLKFNSKILKSDFISFDKLAANNSVNVYIPLVNINNYLFEKFGAFDYKHFASILIETLLQKESTEKEDVIYLNVNDTSFEIIGVKNRSLTFYNTFEYESKEDFIYYILFTVEQLQLNPETIKMVIIDGISEKDVLFKILYKYVRFVTVLKPNYTYSIEPNVDHNFNNYTLLNSFN